MKLKRSLNEVGRTISATNEAKLRAAMKQINDILALLGAAAVETDTSEAATARTKPMTRADVLAGLQKLIDLLSAQAKEDLEGGAALIQTQVGDPVPLAAAESLGDHLARLIPKAVEIAAREARIDLYEGQYTTEQRAALAKAGKAIPVKNAKGEVVDGAYPIDDKEDLANAKQSVGRATPKGPAYVAQVKAHINKQADRLGEAKLGEAKLDEAAGLVCGSCGAAVDNAYDRYCDQCGASLRTQAPDRSYCSSCGGGLDGDDKYCPSCGAQVMSSVVADEAMKPHEHVTDEFGKMSPVEQKNHLVAQHGVKPEDDVLNVPPKRISLHGDQHSAVSESAIELETEFIPLVEKAVAPDGTFPVKIIAPGWGASGYYGRKVLERDIPAVFPSGTKMFWNHPTDREAKERPERDLRDLAAVTISDPVWQEHAKEGPGMYTTAKAATKQYAESIDELAKHIGVSIRAAGLASTGTAEGRTGSIVEKISRGRTIDFVTEPGAGGKIMQQFMEAAGRGRSQPTEENDVGLEEDLKEAKRRNTELEQELGRLRERDLLRNARDFAESELVKVEGLPKITLTRLIESLATDPPHDEDFELDKPAFRKKIKETVRRESEYLESVMKTGRPRGLGSSQDENEEEFEESGGDEEGEPRSFLSGNRVPLRAPRDLENNFRRLGLPESVAKEAARGR